MVLTVTVAASAQWDLYEWKRVPRTADGNVDLKAPARRTPYGKPDLSGFWTPEDPRSTKGKCIRLRPGIQELDLEGAVLNRVLLTDELV